MNPRIFLTAIAAGLVCAQALAAPPAAAPAGPWAKVPALSTLCYGFAGEEWEPFIGKLETGKR
jgi:hypothetical protein